MKNNSIKNNYILDKTKIKEFMLIINSSEIFYSRPDLAERYNLICAFKDRLYTAVDYLNKYTSVPESETDFINYMVYASMLYDGIKHFYENLFSKVPDFIKRKKYFKNVKNYNSYYFTDETCPEDYVFFEYLRSMTFAHPYDTTKKRYTNRLFMDNGEIHYCPWVVINDITSIFNNIPDSVGIKIYSNKKRNESDIITLTFSFGSLQGFIQEVYNKGINNFIDWAKQEIDNQNSIWINTKVNRNRDTLSILKEIKSILETRFKDTYTIDRAIMYLTCDLTIDTNIKNVDIFRGAIKNKIIPLCDCIDNLDYEGIEEQLSLLYDRPDNLHDMADYQLEKIYTYLYERSEDIDPHSDECWGLQQAYNFYNQFAKKWVTIDVVTMQYDEIKLLVATACYLERQEQMNKKYSN